ncbi:hypothetical protein M885DRAFT_563297, partial [Pelagophyceae sp. CCMP2097]
MARRRGLAIAALRLYAAAAPFAGPGGAGASGVTAHASDVTVRCADAPRPDLVGDGVCDAANNIDPCFDGGDCLAQFARQLQDGAKTKRVGAKTKQDVAKTKQDDAKTRDGPESSDGPEASDHYYGEGFDICGNTCSFADDGECDDGEPGAAFANCACGSDCNDCGMRASCDGNCDNSCVFASDGECDDGEPGAQFRDCACGTDCDDCGTRTTCEDDDADADADDDADDD